ncbi:ADP-ribosylglycohydrolase family protein [Streptomyces ipomoeae]|uniref:ADP-ribosylglycohydrolase family protein n=1 Tax=Streptomyces ipomoeae TaxID=103232 RepID=UPI001146149B|nr:ADP-ribosylglycohydrolase family protein [Streptomyces ipomoeae]MDX2697795.1 ADP-ribosylglycohydrolase family protein [Streptomyces ipomoeae]MDX2843365.1 ADP-ribosylglycohydrolase family protein [Streptomyces ipomoeae]TQE23182.1 ADP-ribosylglycohydrolase family protein [Streptomyces ipomoeae]
MKPPTPWDGTTPGTTPSPWDEEPPGTTSAAHDAAPPATAPSYGEGGPPGAKPISWDAATTAAPAPSAETAPTVTPTSWAETISGGMELTVVAQPLAPRPAVADGENAPHRPPAPDDESRTGDAGGAGGPGGTGRNNPAEGETEARTAHPPEGRRIEGLLLGLAAGDAAGWPAARHRAARMPEWTRRLTRELDTFAEQNATTTLPVPIALNQPPEPLRLGPSDDAEWAAFAAEAVLRAGDAGALGDLSLERRTRASIDLSWNAVASEIAAAAERAPEVESAVLPLRARISVRAGLGNLATGLRPPATGHDNPHYFDDAACVRACVLAIAHPGEPRPAAELAEFDARYTQDGDGVHGARAMAAALALALVGADVDDCVAAALAELPEETEIGRNARHALDLAHRHKREGTFALVPLLEHQIVDHVYSYGIAAAETVPVALALATAARGRIAEAVPAAACLSRVADSAPALAGALTGALSGGAAIPDAWRDACRTLSGCALPRLTGTDLVHLAELLAATELAVPGG